MILHWSTKFYANRMITDRVMTSYWFYKIAAIALQMYFRFLIWPHLTFRKVQSYRHTKFWPDTSIHGRDITTSSFWKQTAAILKFYFRFWLWPFYCHRHVVFHRHSKFHWNRIICGRVMTSKRFSRWRPSAMLDLFWVMVAHPRSAGGACWFVLKFWLYRIYSFRDKSLYILAFWLEIAYWRPVLGGFGGIFPKWRRLLL